MTIETKTARHLLNFIKDNGIEGDFKLKFSLKNGLQLLKFRKEEPIGSEGRNIKEFEFIIGKMGD